MIEKNIIKAVTEKLSKVVGSMNNEMRWPSPADAHALYLETEFDLKSIQMTFIFTI